MERLWTVRPLCQDENTLAQKVGKHAAGRLLDGQQWNEYPERSP